MNPRKAKEKAKAPDHDMEVWAILGTPAEEVAVEPGSAEETGQDPVKAANELVRRWPFNSLPSGMFGAPRR